MSGVLADVLGWACLAAGSLFVLAGGIGMLRLPDFFTRLHAAGVTDTLGAALILAGLATQVSPGLVTVKLVLIMALLVLTSPTATHALAKASLHGGLRPGVAQRGEPPSNT